MRFQHRTSVLDESADPVRLEGIRSQRRSGRNRARRAAAEGRNGVTPNAAGSRLQKTRPHRAQHGGQWRAAAPMRGQGHATRHSRARGNPANSAIRRSRIKARPQEPHACACPEVKIHASSGKEKNQGKAGKAERIELRCRPGSSSLTLPLQYDQSDNHQGDRQYLDGAQRLVQKNPGQDGDLRQHCIVD